MIKILLFLFEKKLFEVVNIVNDEIISNENKSSNAIFLANSKNLSKYKSIRAIEKLNFLTLNTRKVFNFSKQVFTLVLIFQYFDLKYYIWIKINISNYTIRKILSWLTDLKK